ncbi:MAG: hypothetical protein RL196_419 [Actinomycetota bacterium]
MKLRSTLKAIAGRCLEEPDETGSIAPLAIGLATVLLAATLTFVNAGALLLFQERETQQAEALALAVDGELTPDQLAGAKINPTVLEASARSFAREAGILDFQAGTPDGFTVVAKVCSAFKPPIALSFLDFAGNAEAGHVVCATAKARRL